MFRSHLTENEVDRVKFAARKVGFPWEPIVARPKTARQFYRRVEAETQRDVPRSGAYTAGINLLAAGC